MVRPCQSRKPTCKSQLINTTSDSTTHIRYLLHETVCLLCVLTKQKQFTRWTLTHKALNGSIAYTKCPYKRDLDEPRFHLGLVS